MMKFEAEKLKELKCSGLETGFYDFDKLTTGLHEGQLIILAARPAIGKTAFALNIAQNVARSSKKAVVFFSLETQEKILVKRLLANQEEHTQQHTITRKKTVEDLKRLSIVHSQLTDFPIFIDDSVGLRVTDIRDKVGRLANKPNGLGLIIIDYLQLIQGSRLENRQQEVSEIVHQLKILAKELKVPVIALSQVCRSVQQREDKRPILSDLRELETSMEQDADIIAFLYRDDYYQEKTVCQAECNLTELIIRKNQNGRLGTVKLYFYKDLNRFL